MATTRRHNKNDEWLKEEYEQVNEYGRTVYETFFRLAQMTFIINPALAGGYFYIFFKDGSSPLSKYTVLGALISFFGVVYNLGAYIVYLRSHLFMESLLIRVRDINQSIGDARLKLHIALENTVPLNYETYYKDRSEEAPAGNALARLLSGDVLTRWFMLAIIAFWTTVGIFILIQPFVSNRIVFVLFISIYALALALNWSWSKQKPTIE